MTGGAPGQHETGPEGWRSIRFIYPGVEILVTGAEPGHLAWLQEFVCPDFVTAAPGPADHTVFLEIDTGRYLDLWRRGPDPSGAQVDAFALDSGTVRLPRWRSQPDELTVFDREYRVFYVATADKRTVRLVAPRFGLSVRNSLMRVVRELAMIASQRQGGLIVHGAAVVVDGRGVVFAGPKKAGKTTLLVHVLSQPGAWYVANDRVLVMETPAGMVLRGIPTIVAVRARTAKMMPQFERRLLDKGFHAWSTLCESAQQGRRRGRASGNGWSLSPAQIATVLGVTRTAGGPFDGLFFPRVTGANGGIELRRLTVDEAVEHMRGALFRAGAPTRHAKMLAWADDEAKSAATRDSACRRIVARVPCFECMLGRDAYEDPRSAADLFARAAASRG